MKKQIIGFLLALAATAALAQQGPQGYLTDTNGQIVRSGTGLCWHTGYWTPANATVEGCDNYAKAAPAGAKVTLSADTLFAFDKATLKPEGKAALDSIIKHAQGIKIEIFAVIGYTDRIGSDKYNLALSDRRAAAVKAYFVSQGIPADAIITQGRGKANPVTGDTCKGQVSKKLISCLQPDRRAVIEIIGSK
jgi:OOP family OmpA-OmpF porin